MEQSCGVDIWEQVATGNRELYWSSALHKLSLSFSLSLSLSLSATCSCIIPNVTNIYVCHRAITDTFHRRFIAVERENGKEDGPWRGQTVIRRFMVKKKKKEEEVMFTYTWSKWSDRRQWPTGRQRWRTPGRIWNAIPRWLRSGCWPCHWWSANHFTAIDCSSRGSERDFLCNSKIVRIGSQIELDLKREKKMRSKVLLDSFNKTKTSEIALNNPDTRIF